MNLQANAFSNSVFGRATPPAEPCQRDANAAPPEASPYLNATFAAEIILEESA
jgi:hypothetical protein